MLSSYSLLGKSRRTLLALTTLIVTLALFLSGCSGLKSFVARPQKIEVPPQIGPVVNAAADQLIAEVNRLSEVRSLKGKIDIQFQENSFAAEGIAEKYRSADGTVYLQRPGQIYLAIQAPLVGTKIAEMTSDGEHFRVAVLQGDEKYKRFIKGTNSAVYPKLTTDEGPAKKDGKGKKTSSNNERTVGALSSLRPQHITDALLIRPVAPRTESGYVYAQSEMFEEEADTRLRAQKGARILRSYYLLDELAPGGPTGARLLRRFWFDRVGTVRLARLQTFDDAGALVTDVSYGDLKNFGEGGQTRLPVRVDLTRPQDRYKLTITYQAPEEVTVNQEINPKVFVLENKWQLPEVDLDTREGQNKIKQ